MKPLRPRRARCVEPLEPRQLLAGTVHVEFVGEDLVLTGDDEANRFAVVGDGEPGRQAGSFSIVPDESTSVNGQPPGEPLEIEGRVVNVRILPGEGEDDVRVSDLAIRGGLTIETSSGADRYSIENSAVGGLRLNSGGPIDVCKVPAPPAPVFPPAISVDGVTAIGSAHIESDECGGSVRLDDLDVNGTLDIVSAGRTDITLESSKVARGGYIKIGSIEGEAEAVAGSGGGGSVAIIDSRFGAGLTIESEGEPIDAEILRTRVQGGVVKFHSTGEDAGSRLEIGDSRLNGGLDIFIEGDDPEVHMDGVAARGGEPGRVRLKLRHIDKSTPLLMQHSAFEQGLDVLVLALHPANKSTPILMTHSSFGEGLSVESDHPLDLTLDRVRSASVDMFLKLGDVVSEASAIGDGSVRVLNSRLDGLDITVEGDDSPELTIEDTHVRKRPGRVKYGDITLKRGVIDKATPILMKRSSFDGGLEIESDRPLDLTLDAVVSASLGAVAKVWVLTGEATGTVGGSGGSILMSKSRLDGLDITALGDGTPEVVVEDTVVRSSPARLHLGDFTVVKTVDKSSPILMQRSSFQEGISIVTDRPLDLTLGDVRAASVDMFLKLGDVVGEASALGDGSVRVLSSRLDGLDITVEGDASLELTIEDTHVRKRPGRVKYSDITLVIEANKATPILMTHSSFEGGLEIESDRPLDLTLDAVRSAAVDLFLKLPDVPGEVSASGGGGRVAIVSSRVDGDLTVESNAPLHLSMQSSRAGGAFLKFDGIKGEALADGTLSTVGSHVVLSDSVLHGDLRLVAGAGDEQMQMDRVRVRGRTQIDLGGGDDRLQIVDSVFREFASLDGGDGHDLLSLDNARFRGGFELLNWEEITGSPRAPRRPARF